MEWIECVKCVSCGKLHPKDSETFYVFHGNVTIGLKGGIIGGLKNGEQLETVVCRVGPPPEPCLLKLFGMNIPTTGER